MTCRKCGHPIEVRAIIGPSSASPSGTPNDASKPGAPAPEAVSPTVADAGGDSTASTAPAVQRPSNPPSRPQSPEVNPSIISSRSAHQTGQFRSFPSLNAFVPSSSPAAPSPAAAAALAQQPPPPSQPGARRPVSILPPPLPAGDSEGGAAPSAQPQQAPPEESARDIPADSDGNRPARVPSVRPGMLAYPAMPIPPNSAAAETRQTPKPESQFEILQAASPRAEASETTEEDDSVVTRRANELADMMNAPSPDQPAAPSQLQPSREPLPSAPDNQEPIPLERRTSIPPAPPAEQRSSGPPSLPQRISANAPPPSGRISANPPPPPPQRISSNGPPSGRISANPPPPPPQRISSNGPPSGRISANPPPPPPSGRISANPPPPLPQRISANPPPPLPQRISANPPPPLPQRISANPPPPPSVRTPATPPPPSGRAHLPPLGAPPTLAQPQASAPPPSVRPAPQRVSAPPPLPLKAAAPKLLPEEPIAPAEAAPPPEEPVPASTESPQEAAPILRPKRRRGLHPMAYAFIAMSAVFGGVAAFVLLYPPTVPALPAAPSGTLTQTPTQTPTEDPSNAILPVATVSPGSPDPSAQPAPPAEPSISPELPKSNARSLSNKDVNDVIAQNQPMILRKCWQPALEAKIGGGPSARINATLLVGDSGKVESVTVGGSERDYPGLSTCIANRIRLWKFPSAGGKTNVTIPFVFSGP